MDASSIGDLPSAALTLHEYHLRLAGRAWTVRHTGAILSHDDEQRFLGITSGRPALARSSARRRAFPRTAMSGILRARALETASAITFTADTMGTGRLEAFSDGVIAILITIMVLELRVPHGDTLEALRPLFPVLLSYILSFVYLGIYWNNHHHMLHVTRQVDGAMLWANLHLLFWLSLVPFVTGWMGENHFASLPTAMYGVVLFMAAIAYYILARVIVAREGPDSVIAKALGADWKGKVSLVPYALAIPAAFIHPGIAGALYVVVALMWLVPDRRIERMIATHDEGSES